MSRISIMTAAVLAGAAGAAFVPGVAEAKPKAKPQVFTCRAGKAAYKDNGVSRTGAAMCNVGRSTFFNYALVSNQIKINIKTRSATTYSWLLPCLSTKDIRTAGVLPLTFRPGGTDDTVAGAYGITSGASVTGSWVTNEDDPNSFSVVFKKYDAATGRLSGSFGGTLAPGETPSGQSPLKVTKGSFNILVDFHGF